MTRGTASGDQVARGSNGRLFLDRQDSYSLEAFVDGSLLPAAAVRRWRLTIERRARELAVIGVPYVLVIVPDAPSIYPEDLPAALACRAGPGHQSIGARLEAALQGIHNLTLVYPLQAMLEAKGGLPLYRKTDTHWSGFGAYVGYRVFCQAIAHLAPIAAVAPATVQFVLRPEFGDLGILLDPEQGGFNATMRIEGHTVQRLGTRSAPELANTQSFRCAEAPPTRALIMRDSFMTEQAPLVAATFGTTEMVGTTSRLFIDRVLATRPDLVVTEICERRLSEWESDHQITGYDDLFATDWVTDAGPAVLAVEMAMRQGRADDAATAAEALIETSRDFSPGHTLSLARAMTAGSAAAKADRLLTRALAASPGQVSLRLAAAQAKFALNDGLAALSMAYEARDMTPWNGFTHELLLYMLLTFGRIEEAREVFDAAAPRITDHPNLFLLGSQAAERAGDRQGAASAMGQATQLWPDNQAFQDRLASLTQACRAELVDDLREEAACWT